MNLPMAPTPSGPAERIKLVIDSFPAQLARTQRFTLGVPRSFQISPDGSRVAFLRSRGGADPLTCVTTIVHDRLTGARTLNSGLATGTRVAWRSIFAMARTGSDFSGRSGDYAVAFSTAEYGPQLPG